MADAYITLAIGIIVGIGSIVGILSTSNPGLGFVVAAIFICGGLIIAKIHKGFMLIKETIDEIVDEKFYIITLFYKEQYKQRIQEKFPDATYFVYKYVDLKSEQDINSETVGRLQVGTPVKFVKIGEKIKLKKITIQWINIETLEGKNGWCSLNCLKKI
jgi:hypothetical protein